uniref:Peptidase A1 domain-containing protein n=1 Tax=Oryza punctata TaxID=4537 RepID=A0A0E0MA69_ORYPU
MRHELQHALFCMLMETLHALCLISLTTCSPSTRAASFRAHELRRGLEQAVRGRLLADAAGGGAVVPIHWFQAHYVANFTIGTPPQPSSAYIDLAGELVWTQCSQCSSSSSSCFKQELPMFASRSCSSWRAASCGWAVCACLSAWGCRRGLWLSGGSSRGCGTGCLVGTAGLTVGCSSARLGFWWVVAGGVARLGWSSCLVDVAGLVVVVAVVALRRGGRRVVLGLFWAVRLLVDGGFEAVRQAVTSAIGAAPTATPLKPFDVCFPKAGAATNGVAPDLVLTFQGGAAMTVPPSKYLLDDGNGAVCLAILSSARLNLTSELDGLSAGEHPFPLRPRQGDALLPTCRLQLTLLIVTLLVLCLISLTTCAAALCGHDLRRGDLEQAMRGRLLADDATAPGGAVVPFYWSRELYNVANFTIGTPPQPASAFIDLAGEAVWTQCSQCIHCFKQDLPVFVPNASSTFKPEPCGTDVCKSIPTSKCASNVCAYDGTTMLGGHTVGIVATDMFAIGTATAASLAFGCVVASDIDTMGGPSGFIGLGRTPWSLVTQMKLTRFSYCLAPHDTGKNSQLFLGASAKFSGGGKSSSTPFVKTSPDDDMSKYYPVELEEIKAGDATIAMPQGRNTVLVQTAVTRVSLLVDSVYQDFKKAVMASVVAAPTATPVQPFEVCFPKAVVSSAPDLVFTFQAGAALTVPPANYLFDAGNDTVCLSVMSIALLNMTALDGLNILGSFQQENVHWS